MDYVDYEVPDYTNYEDEPEDALFGDALEDEYEASRLETKVSMVGWLYRQGKSTVRPDCRCCGSWRGGIRRGHRRLNKFNPLASNYNVWRGNRVETRGRKPRHKDKR